MPAHADTATLADEIISSVRSRILEESPDEDMDPWNEEESGAAWLDNELSMGTELLSKVGARYLLDSSEFSSIEGARQELTSLPRAELQFYHYIVVRQGGSTNDELFALRNKSTETVRAFIRRAYH